MAVRWRRILPPLLLALSLLLAPMESQAAKKPPGTGGDTGGKATVLTISAPAETSCTQFPVSATLTSRGTPLGGQSISLTVDGQPAGSATTDANGVASFTAEVSSAGSHQLTVRFAGARAYAASEASATTTVLITHYAYPQAHDSVAYYGDPAEFITSDRFPGETITFYLNGNLVGQAVAGANGEARTRLGLGVTLPAGEYPITTDPLPTPSFSKEAWIGEGESQGCGSIAEVSYPPGTLFVSPQPASFIYTGDTTMFLHTSLTLRVAVTTREGNGGDITKAGPVRFELRTSPNLTSTPLASYGNVPVDAQGVASVVTDLHPYQNYYVTVLQDGTDNRYYQAPSIQAVITAPTLQPTTLTAPNLTAAHGQEIELQAVLTDGQGQPIPNRAIYFQVHDTYAGKAVTDSVGTAVLTYLVNQGAGSYIIEVWFPGDAAYAESGAAPLLTVTN